MLGDLLGDGRAARHAFLVGREQLPDRAAHALVVDATVLVEPRVLDRDEGILQPFGHFLDLHRVAPGLAEQTDQTAVARIDVERFLQFDIAQALHVWQFGRDRGVEDGEREAAHEQTDEAQQERPAQKTANAGHGGVRSSMRVAMVWRGL